MADIHELINAAQTLKPGEAVTSQEWGVFNDPDFWKPKFDAGEIHADLREKIIDEPLFTSPIPGPAKRYQEYYNKQREEFNQVETAGYTVLRVQTVTREPWRTVSGQEWDDIDDGKRPNGR